MLTFFSTFESLESAITKSLVEQKSGTNQLFLQIVSMAEH